MGAGYEFSELIEICEEDERCVWHIKSFPLHSNVKKKEKQFFFKRKPLLNSLIVQYSGNSSDGFWVEYW